jgi:hypothetical protein
MKCTRKTEDKLRKIVVRVLLFVAFLGVTFAAIVFTQALLTFLAAAAVLFGLAFLIVWLAGDFSFCKGDN